MWIRLRNAQIFRNISGTWRLETEIGAESVAPLRRFLEGLKGRDVAAELKVWRKKRSLDANSYAWKLLSLIADELTLSDCVYTKNDMYIEMLKRYGQGGEVKVRPGDSNNILREFGYFEKHEKLWNEDAQYYRVWVGSSKYDTREMSIFIQGIIAEAKQLGIETMPPRDLERMMNQWQKASCKKNGSPS